jgi:molecular chaperone GrpE (heat shock protein)
MTVGAHSSLGLYENTLMQNNQKKGSQSDAVEAQNDPMPKETPQNLSAPQDQEASQTQDPIFGDLSSEKIVKMVKEFEMRLLEQMGYAPASLAKIKNLTESYRLELVSKMKEEFVSAMVAESDGADKALSGFFEMPLNSKGYLQELFA